MSLLKIFKIIAIIEGISYLALLFVAMPLKYFAGMPLAVTYTGWAHGALVVLYGLFFLVCWSEFKWPLWKAAMIGFASLLPFAPFYVERKYLNEADTQRLH